MLPGSISGLMRPCRDLLFSHENVQLLARNFYARIFSQREFSSCQEYYQDFASQLVSRQDPGGKLFSGQDPGEYRFLCRILAEIRGENFSREGSCWENGPPWRDPNGIPASARNLGGILAGSRYLFYKGIDNPIFQSSLSGLLA